MIGVGAKVTGQGRLDGATRLARVVESAAGRVAARRRGTAPGSAVRDRWRADDGGREADLVGAEALARPVRHVVFIR